ncbi:MarR family winged helix-turn-helix transcriptional regulator [Planotetraspora silvatica]|nr:MarR family transcriptional regulator [Planotetraspora silvatica]
MSAIGRAARSSRTPARRSSTAAAEPSRDPAGAELLSTAKPQIKPCDTIFGTHRHYAVLATLEESGSASQAELSRRTGIYRSDVVAVINELADRGLVEHAHDPAARRRNVITMTQQGRSQLQRLDKLLAAIEDEVLAPLARREHDQFTELLTRLVDHHARSHSRGS